MRNVLLAGLLTVLCVTPLKISSDSTSKEVTTQSKPCLDGCTKNGNCNHEEGRCECPWGFTGDTCQTDRMAVCKQTPDDPGSCGLMMPKNCECYRECHRLYCRYGSNTDQCVSHWGTDSRDAVCWLYGSNFTDAMKRPQLSSLYPEKPENNTVWFNQIPEYEEKTQYDEGLLLSDESRRFMSPFHKPWLVWHLAPNVAKPLSECPANCGNGRGYCLLLPGTSAPSCMCHMGFRGDNCTEEEPEEACWFSPNCTARGVCRSGFCHCKPGYWGFGCHRSLAVIPTVPGTIPDLRNPTTLKIYMYELPWEVAFPYEVKEDIHTHDPMYIAYELFLQYFLNDTTVRTENPYEANLFYVPALTYYYAENSGNPQWQAEVAINYVRTKWPFYNRTGGRDHFLFMTGDRGACGSQRWLQDSVIKVVHFGMQKRALNWTAARNKDYGCIQVKRDLVVPPRTHGNLDLHPIDAVNYYETLRSAGGRDSRRTILFFFAGGVGDWEYSGGTRMALRELFRSIANKDAMPQDVIFVEGGTQQYSELLRTSKFCLAPYGYGWGIRLMQSIHFGCIPVIVQDHVYQPFEDFLPYEEFSVRMRLSDVPHVIELLRGFSEEQLAALRLGMAKYYRAFIWEREFGGKAYEWTLAGLQRRAYNLNSEYYEGHPVAVSPEWKQRLLRGVSAAVAGWKPGRRH